MKNEVNHNFSSGQQLGMHLDTENLNSHGIQENIHLCIKTEIPPMDVYRKTDL